MDTPGVEYLKNALLPLCGSLHEVFNASAATSREIRADHKLADRQYNSMGADVTRALAHRELAGRDDLEGWSLGGRHNLRGQLMLINGMTKLQFLHDPHEEVPPPGRNASRRAYYRNVPLAQSAAYAAEAHKLIAVWRVVDEELSTVTFRVVRPIGDTARWKMSSTPVDLDFILPDLGEDLASLEFEQYDEDLQINLPDEAEGGEDAGAGSNG